MDLPEKSDYVAKLVFFLNQYLGILFCTSIFKKFGLYEFIRESEQLSCIDVTCWVSDILKVKVAQLC